MLPGFLSVLGEFFFLLWEMPARVFWSVGFAECCIEVFWFAADRGGAAAMPCCFS